MSFIEHLHIWVKGETLQGKIMILLGGLLLFSILWILQNKNILLSGMVIPLSLLLIMNIGYGCVLVFRPQSSKKIEAAYLQKPESTVLEQYNKSVKGADGYYAIFTKVWGAMVIASVVLFFIVKNLYVKGFLLGLSGIFFGMLLIDFFLYSRIQVYIAALGHLLNQR